jgi:formyl-CoA transferase
VNELPLEGIRILDAGVLFGGPMAATLLGDFGAEVIKVEHPNGDPLRQFGWQEDDESLFWQVVGRNKRSVVLDLGSEDGQQAFVELAARSDVVIESFRPGTFDRWNLGYERLAERNPGLVMLRVSGFGQRGPYSGRPGFGTLAEAMSGFAATTGQADGPPTLPSIALADGVTAVTAAMSILIALRHRDAHGGRGQEIDITLVEPLMWILGPQATVFDRLGVVQQRVGSRTEFSAPRNLYQGSDGKWLAISASSANIARRALEVVGGPELVADPRFATNALRVEHNDELDATIADWVADRTRDEALRIFEDAHVAVAPVYDISELVEDPHFRERGTFVRENGYLMQGMIAQLSETPGRVRTPAPTKGQHTEEVLREAGLDPELIGRLLAGVA